MTRYRMRKQADDNSQRVGAVDSVTSLICLTLGAFVIGTEGFMIAGLPALAEDLNVDVPTAGNLVTVFSLAYAICAPLSDRAALGAAHWQSIKPKVIAPRCLHSRGFKLGDEFVSPFCFRLVRMSLFQ